MSRSRILSKLRPQPSFEAMTRWLDAEGINWQLVPPTGHSGGHPSLALVLPCGTRASYKIGCTPAQRRPLGEDLGGLRRCIREATMPRVPEPRRKSAWTPERIACLTRGVNPLAGRSPGAPRG